MTLVVTALTLAICGCLKHYHWWPTERLVSWLSTFTAALGTAPALLPRTTGPPTAAGSEARAAVSQLRSPGGYFGIHGELTCVTPVVPMDKIPSHGGTFTPNRPHLLFGVANGRATLWDPTKEQELSVPGNMVRLTPYEPATSTAGRCPPAR